MDILLAVLGSLCIIVGLVGSILPILPGPPIGYAGILFLHFSKYAQFSNRFLILFAFLTLAVVILDLVIPVLGAKRFGGSKYGAWGASIGIVAGFFLGPVGLILGPFLGAVVGEMVAAGRPLEALRAGFGSFIGFVSGTLMKIILSIVLAYYFFNALLRGLS